LSVPEFFCVDYNYKYCRSISDDKAKRYCELLVEKKMYLKIKKRKKYDKAKNIVRCKQRKTIFLRIKERRKYDKAKKMCEIKVQAFFPLDFI
jgi:hypothetical protein